MSELEQLIARSELAAAEAKAAVLRAGLAPGTPIPKPPLKLRAKHSVLPRAPTDEQLSAAGVDDNATLRAASELRGRRR